MQSMRTFETNRPGSFTQKVNSKTEHPEHQNHLAGSRSVGTVVLIPLPSCTYGNVAFGRPSCLTLAKSKRTHNPASSTWLSSWRHPISPRRRDVQTFGVEERKPFLQFVDLLTLSVSIVYRRNKQLTNQSTG